MTSRLESEFAGLWQKTHRRVRAYMVCACSNRSDAEDLAQECYVRALRSWARFDGRGSRDAWLFAIARNTHIDWLRRQGRQIRMLESCERSEPEVGSQSHAGDAEQLWAAVEKLSDEHREVIRLRFAADLNYAEMSEALGLPVGTVRSRLHRGLKALRERTEERQKWNARQ
jgi:RNA polymerase sigma-70 factor (ECF subfamily)